jgi:murein DD-endopeptidase MepM/ murein hydrolase activator NlpD
LLRRLAATLFALTCFTFAQPPTFEPIPVAVSVPTPPVAFVGDGTSHLCYEIFLTNMSKDAWTLDRIEARDDANATVTKLDAAALETVLRHPGNPDLKGDALFKLAPGERMIAFVWINLTGPAPKQLHHLLAWHKENDKKPHEMQGGATPVLTGLPNIPSPLRGKRWVAANGPSNTSGHRRALLVIDGVPHISQRYAIDWVQIDEKGSTHHGDEKNNANYYCHGVDALAIADATVVEVKDGIPENVPNQKPAVEITLETVAGNHVNLDLGGGVYAMYAHFQPGSIKVKAGDRVTRGQLLGLVGNTGNSSEPHLHFQLMNANSPLGAEGLPYTMDFTLTGRGNGDKPGVYPLPAPESRHGQMPMEDEVVDF